MTSLSQSAADLIRKWQAADAALAAAKTTEMELRKLVVQTVYGDNADTGTNHFDLGNGWDLKYVRKINYSLDRDTVEDALEALRASGNEGVFIADRLVTFDPRLSVSEYKKLDEKSSYRKIIDRVLTTSDGAPVLEVVPPKGA